MCLNGLCITRDGPTFALPGARDRETRDLLRLVAGALEVGDGTRHREDHAQVARHRRAARQQPEAFRLDLRLPLVDLLLARQHQLRRLPVRFEQGTHGGFHLVRDQSCPWRGRPSATPTVRRHRA